MGKGEIARYEQFLLSPPVFSKRFVSQGHQKVLLCGNGLTLPNNPDFNDPKKKAFWKTLWEKERMLETSITFSVNSCLTLYQTIQTFNDPKKKPF